MSPSSELEEVAFDLHTLERLDKSFIPILATVTSTSVRKITFEINDTIEDPENVDLEHWSLLDTMLLSMARKLEGTDKKLEIVFELHCQRSVPVDLSKFLKKCWTETIVRYCRGWVGCDIRTQLSCHGNPLYISTLFNLFFSADRLTGSPPWRGLPHPDHL